MACCSSGLEFKLADTSLVYPDDYPADNTEVTVEGKLETYKDSPDAPYSFVRLGEATLEK